MLPEHRITVFADAVFCSDSRTGWKRLFGAISESDDAAAYLTSSLLPLS